MERDEGPRSTGSRVCTQLGVPHLYHSQVLAMRGGLSSVKFDWCVICGCERKVIEDVPTQGLL